MTTTLTVPTQRRPESPAPVLPPPDGHPYATTVHAEARHGVVCGARVLSTTRACWVLSVVSCRRCLREMGVRA